MRGDTLGQGETVIGACCTSCILTWIVCSPLRPAASWYLFEQPLRLGLLLQLALDGLGQPPGIGESLFSKCMSRLRHSPSGCCAAEHPATLFLSFLGSAASNQGEAVEHLELQRGSSCRDLRVPRRVSVWATVGRQMESWSHIPFPSEWDDSDVSIKKLQGIVREHCFDRWQNVFSFFLTLSLLNVLTCNLKDHRNYCQLMSEDRTEIYGSARTERPYFVALWCLELKNKNCWRGHKMLRANCAEKGWWWEMLGQVHLYRLNCFLEYGI